MGPSAAYTRRVLGVTHGAAPRGTTDSAEVRIGSLSVVRGAFFMSIHPGITCNEISCQQASRAAQARAESRVT